MTELLIMTHYTQTIPLDIAEKLKKAGMPMSLWNGTNQEIPSIGVMEDSVFDWLDKELGNEVSKVERRYCVPTYAEVFDWLIDKGIIVMVTPSKAPSDIVGENGRIGKPCKWFSYVNGRHNPRQGTWHEAANRAIEDSIYLLKK